MGDLTKNFSRSEFVCPCCKQGAVDLLHDRIPVIFSNESVDLWLNPDVRDVESLSLLFAPSPPDELEAYAVTNDVNSPKLDSPRCITPAENSSW